MIIIIIISNWFGKLLALLVCRGRKVCVYILTVSGVMLVFTLKTEIEYRAA
jgi:hypothetical protein